MILPHLISASQISSFNKGNAPLKTHVEIKWEEPIVTTRQSYSCLNALQALIQDYGFNFSISPASSPTCFQSRRLEKQAKVEGVEMVVCDH